MKIFLRQDVYEMLSKIGTTTMKYVKNMARDRFKHERALISQGHLASIYLFFTFFF